MSNTNWQKLLKVQHANCRPKEKKRRRDESGGEEHRKVVPLSSMEAKARHDQLKPGEGKLTASGWPTRSPSCRAAGSCGQPAQTGGGSSTGTRAAVRAGAAGVAATRLVDIRRAGAVPDAVS